MKSVLIHWSNATNATVLKLDNVKLVFKFIFFSDSIFVWSDWRQATGKFRSRRALGDSRSYGRRQHSVSSWGQHVVQRKTSRPYPYPSDTTRPHLALPGPTSTTRNDKCKFLKVLTAFSNFLQLLAHIVMPLKLLEDILNILAHFFIHSQHTWHQQMRLEGKKLQFLL